jgi:4-hydroxybenzoate polyprenyltransferase
VALWTAGFDILYSLQDEDFDKKNNLRSLPASIGRKGALLVSRLCHVGAFGALCGSVVAVGGGAWLWAGVAGVALMLAYEQSLVKADDLSRVNMAFFTVNGFVSIGFFLFAWIDVVVRSM